MYEFTLLSWHNQFCGHAHVATANPLYEAFCLHFNANTAYALAKRQLHKYFMVGVGNVSHKPAGY